MRLESQKVKSFIVIINCDGILIEVKVFGPFLKSEGESLNLHLDAF